MPPVLDISVFDSNCVIIESAVRRLQFIRTTYIYRSQFPPFLLSTRYS